LGVTNFIWLDGIAGLEITDMHIDGFARFGNATTLVTMEQDDLLEWEVPLADIQKLYAAKDKNGIAYTLLKLPLTQNQVVTTYGKNLGYKGSYINYYIANTKILVPNYNDPHDALANELLQNLYPNRTVVGIDVRNLYANGGMIHCVTQQQPQSLVPSPPQPVMEKCMAIYSPIDGRLHIPQVQVFGPEGNSSVYAVDLQQRFSTYEFILDLNTVKPQ
jgi:agmatine deiminase